MPREAPVTSAIRSARGGGMAVDLNCARSLFGHSSSLQKNHVAKDPIAEPSGRVVGSTRLGEQRQLPRRGVLAGLVGQRRRIVAGEAVVGELRPQRIAPL